MSKRLPPVDVPAVRVFVPTWNELPMGTQSKQMSSRQLVFDHYDDSLLDGSLRPLSAAEIAAQRANEAKNRAKIAENALPSYSRRQPQVGGYSASADDEYLM